VSDRILEVRARSCEARDNDAVAITVSGPDRVGPPRDFVCRIESAAMSLRLEVPGVDPLQSIRLALKGTLANLGWIYAGSPSRRGTLEPLCGSTDRIPRPLIALSLLPFGHGRAVVEITIDGPLRDESMNLFYCRVICRDNHWHVHAFSDEAREAILSALHVAIERASTILCDSFVDQSGE
jgi:hypothetical protein